MQLYNYTFSRVDYKSWFSAAQRRTVLIIVGSDLNWLRTWLTAPHFCGILITASLTNLAEERACQRHTPKAKSTFSDSLT